MKASLERTMRSAEATKGWTGHDADYFLHGVKWADRREARRALATATRAAEVDRTLGRDSGAALGQRELEQHIEDLTRQIDEQGFVATLARGFAAGTATFIGKLMPGASEFDD